MSIPFDPANDDADYDPGHPDLQHEQPPVEATSDPEDSTPGSGEADLGELPESIPEAEDGT